MGKVGTDASDFEVEAAARIWKFTPVEVQLNPNESELTITQLPVATGEKFYHLVTGKFI